MSKHVSLHTLQPRSFTFFYCVDSKAVIWDDKVHLLNMEKLTIDQLCELVDGSFFQFEVAHANLCYLLRLDNVLMNIDTKQMDAPGLNRLWNAKYLGRRPRTCCPETGSGGLARGKSNAS